MSASVARVSRIFLLVPLLLVISGCGFNDIPTYEEAAKAKWSDVLNQYQRRTDLIPNLVETVKGFAKQESSVLEGVTTARAQATSVKVDASTITDPEAFKKFQDAQAQLSGSLGRLLAISENYPDLKSNQNFLALQRNSKELKTALRLRAATTSKLCAGITRSSRLSLAASGP